MTTPILDESLFTPEGVAAAPRPSVRFYIEERQDKAATASKGVVQYRPIEMVEIKPPYSKDRAAREITPSLFIECRKKGYDIEPEYKAWKETGDDEPILGTPLKEVPVISRSQVELLKHIGIRSLDQLVAIERGELSKLGPEGIEAQKQAIRWQKAADKAVDKIALVKELDEAKQRIAALENEMRNLSAKYFQATGLQAPQ